MGTDIHLYVEMFDGEKWAEIPPPYETGYGYRSWLPDCDSHDFDDPRPNPIERNYNLFALLANVRNGRGFAGIKTGEPVTPLFAERDFPPAGMSYTEAVYDDDGELVSGAYLGEHSFTWATLDELLAVNWATIFHRTGVVDLVNFRLWQNTGAPKEWSGKISGPGIRTYPANVYALIEKEGIATDEDYAQVDWVYTPLIGCGFERWCKEVLSPLADGHPENVRVLIGFDS